MSGVRSKLNTKGMALAWVMMIIIVFMIIGTAALTISSAMHSRSVNKIVQQQAYLTAKSGIDAVAMLFKSDKIFIKDITEKVKSGPVQVETIDFGEDMGICDVTISAYGGDSFKLSAVAKVKEATKKLSATMYKSKTIGAEFPTEPNLGSILDNNGKFITIGNKDDIAVYELTQDNDFSKDTSLKITGLSDVFIYVGAGRTLKFDDITGQSTGELFIILGDGATLYLNPKNSPVKFDMHIYGPNATLRTGEDTEITGTIKIGSEEYGENFSNHARPPSKPEFDFDKIGNNEGKTALYSIGRYIDEE